VILVTGPPGTSVRRWAHDLLQVDRPVRAFIRDTERAQAARGGAGAGGRRSLRPGRRSSGRAVSASAHVGSELETRGEPCWARSTGFRDRGAGPERAEVVLAVMHDVGRRI